MFDADALAAAVDPDGDAVEDLGHGEGARGASVHHPTTRDDPADLTVTLTRGELLALVGGDGSDRIVFEGDKDVLTTILDLTDEPDTGFRIVAP